MGVGAGFGGVCFCPTVKACDLRGENALETLTLQFGLCAAAARWVPKGTWQFFKPLMSIILCRKLHIILWLLQGSFIQV